MLSFGQRLKAIRKGVQLTQAELAEKLMVSVQSISKWECDNAMPDISQIVPLSAVLGVTTDCLLGVGGDEKADRENLYKQVEKINMGIEKVYWRHDNRSSYGSHTPRARGENLFNLLLQVMLFVQPTELSWDSNSRKRAGASGTLSFCRASAKR